VGRPPKETRFFLSGEGRFVTGDESAYPDFVLVSIDSRRPESTRGGAAMTHRFCDDRTCALKGNYTLCLQSQDPLTLLAGLKALCGERDFTAHLFSSETWWGAWIPEENLEEAETLAQRLMKVTEFMGHPIRLLIEDERDHAIEVDRTYHADGSLSEPTPSW
jgi:hypothetical protein